jgi:hypothetical protein
VPARNADGTNSSNTVGIVQVELAGANSEVRARAQTYDHVNAAQIPFPLPKGKQGKKRQMCKSCGQERSGSHYDSNAFTNSEAYCTVLEQDRTPGHHEAPHYYIPIWRRMVADVVDSQMTFYSPRQTYLR